MLIAQVQFAPWDKVYNFSTAGLELSVGDYVIVRTELGLESGRVVALFSQSAAEPAAAEADSREIKPVLRKANHDDLARLPSAEDKEQVMDFCREMISKHQLSMKLVDVHFAYEGNRYNFAFIAEGRIDFRELVKDLAARFNVSIRLTQIGTRDEARITGDCGPCGRGLCCRGCMQEFSSITSEMAEAQQVVHRGSERISGMCGRLMCCLSYEYAGYKDLAQKLPPLGAKVKVDGTSGTVVGHHLLKQTVDVKIPAERAEERDLVVEVDPARDSSGQRDNSGRRRQNGRGQSKSKKK
ncbi:MAG: regulatory iron-sulfur-containing complex subunit RicT [Patescibacteria group bacterium]